MAIKTLTIQDQQPSVTGTSDVFIVPRNSKLMLGAVLTAGTPSTGAKVQFTLDDEGAVKNDTADWFDSEQGNSVTDFSYSEPAPCVFTAVRLVATDGTWTFKLAEAEVQ